MTARHNSSRSVLLDPLSTGHGANKAYVDSVAGGGGGSLVPFNLLSTNPSFDANVTGWTAAGNVALVWDNTQGHAVAGAAKVITNGVYQEYRSATISATPGRTYGISLWVKTSTLINAAGGDLFVWAEAMNGSTIYTSPWGAGHDSMAWEAFSNPVGDNDWTLLQTQLTMPKTGADGIRLVVSVGAAITSGTIWLDDAAIFLPNVNASQVGLLGTFFDGLKSYVDTAVTNSVHSYVGVVGNGTSGPYTVTHNLGTRHVQVLVYRNGAPWEEVLVRTEHTTTNTITLLPDENWATNQYRVLVQYVAQSDSTPPSAPVMSLVSKTDVTVDVSWTVPADNVGVVGYYWWVNGAKGSFITATTFQFTGLTPSTAYTFNVTAVDAEGNESSLSANLNVTTNAASDSTPPTAGVLSFSSKTATTITYTFTGGSDNVGVTHVDAYDATSNTLIAANVTSPWTRGSGTGANAPLANGTSYGTYLKYFDAAGNSANSNTITQTTDTPANVTLNAASAGSRVTSGTTSSDTITIGAGSNIRAYCWVAVGHSASNNPATYDVATLTSNLDGAWTLVDAQANGPFTAQKQGAVLLFEKIGPTVGTHTLSLTISKSTLTFTSIHMQTDAYNNVSGRGTIAHVDAATSAVLNIACAVASGNMGICGVVISGAAVLSGHNATARYNTGSNVTGTGDVMAVLDTAGPISAFTSTSSQVHGAMALELQKVG